jgi:hypothetical protein
VQAFATLAGKASDKTAAVETAAAEEAAAAAEL